jgi:site-specific recombinase XerD
MNKIIGQFKLYLTESKALSKITVKNYLSDLRHFLSWLDLKLQSRGKVSPKKGPSGSEMIYKLQNITPQLLNGYKQYLLSNNIAKSTINRRLATVRLFCQFCYDEGLLEQNLARSLTNLSVERSTDEKVHDLVSRFGAYLKKQGASKSTIKNYTADVRSYLASQTAHEL